MRVTLASTASYSIIAACGGSTKERSAPAVGVSGTTAQAAQPQYGGILNYYEIGNPTLDPHTNARYWTQKAVGGVMSRLLRFKTGADPRVSANRDTEPDLALRLETPDGMTWIAKLRNDARFHNKPPVNGRQVESEDVRVTFFRALTEPKNANRASLGMIDQSQIETPSKDIVVFKLKYPYGPFPKLLASPTYSWIFPREVMGEYDPEKQIIGSGPFVFESFTPDVALTYTRNQNWFEQGRPYVDGVRYAIVPDTAQQLAQFQGGNLDIITVEDTDLPTVKRSKPEATVVTAPPGVPGWVFGQLGVPDSVWEDIRIRRAVSLAIDRDALMRTIAPQGGEFQMIVGTAFGDWALKPGDLGQDVAQWYRFNPGEARKLLDATGRSDFRFKFIYTNNGYGARFNTTAESINSMLNAVGFKTILVTIDYQREWVGGGKGIRYGALPADAMAYGLTAGYDDPLEVLFNYHHSSSNLRNTKLVDKMLDGLLEKARGQFDENERKKTILDIQRYLAEKMYFVAGLPTPYTFVMVQPWIYNFQHTTSYGIFTESFAKLWVKRG